MLPQTIIVLDTETISITKPYIYDLGFIVARLNNETNRYEIIEKSQQIIEQIYDNLALFTTAYYESKRLTYTNLMKGKRAKKIKYGFALRHLQNTIEKYDVRVLTAYNAPFDKKALKFTSNFFKYENDFQSFQWLDIHAIANNFIHLHESYIEYAGKNEWFNPSGYLQTNAEKTYAFLEKNPNYKESHTSLEDCIIELEILNASIERGFDNTVELGQKFVEAKKEQSLILKSRGKEYTFKYEKRINHKNGNITLK